ncbi:MAG: radical SAM protein [Thermoprotei archaeon]|nr:MAG: radical SAM protein [Thermoprotei archaeon]
MVSKSKWQVLVVGARWDICRVPIYRSVGGRLVKTLLSSCCCCSCLYCEFRSGRRVPREQWRVDELVEVVYRLWSRGEVRGLFLSSCMFSDPDRVSEMEVEVAEKLRKLGFRGYIHLRLMPGTDRDVIRRAAEVADRIGINLEAPTPSMFSELCPDKGDFVNDVLKRLLWCIEECRGRSCKVDTQVVVGALEDRDTQYLKLMKYLLHRGIYLIHFSAFEPVHKTPLERRRPCPKSRQKALYQALFLMRDYGFSLEELLELCRDGMLPHVDLKLVYARLRSDMFPVDISTASFRELVRVPGIGPRTARKILELRQERGRVDVIELRKVLGPRYRRAIKYLSFT